jgi:CheY-like chemotaxis protein
MKEMRILCVENRPEDMAVLRYMLEGIGHELMPASNGDEAVDLFSKQVIDGVLLEYNLPDATATQIRDPLKSMRWAPEQPSCFTSSMRICESTRNASTS